MSKMISEKSLNQWNTMFDRKETCQSSVDDMFGKTNLLYREISKEIGILEEKWNLYSDTTNKSVLDQLMNSTGRSFSYLQVKKIVLSLLFKLRHIFAMIGDHMGRMDVWLLVNEIKAFMKEIDGFFYGISFLKPSSTSMAQSSIRKVKRFHDDLVQEILTKMKRRRNKMKDSLPSSRKSLKPEYEHCYRNCEQLFKLKDSKYGQLIDRQSSIENRRKLRASKATPSSMDKRAVSTETRPNHNSASSEMEGPDDKNGSESKLLANDSKKVLPIEIKASELPLSNSVSTETVPHKTTGSETEVLANKGKEFTENKRKVKITVAEYLARKKLKQEPKTQNIVDKNERKRKRFTNEINDKISQDAGDKEVFNNPAKKVRLSSKA